MYVFDCATLKDRDPANYGLTRQQVESVDMSDPCFLIVHPRGTLLWETGLNDAVYDRPEGGGVKHDTIDKSLKSQLAAVGYQPKDITYLAISHLHGDHSGNANDYAGSTWIAQKAERDYMFSQGLPENIHPNEYAALKNSKTKLITGDYDVFGDGSVMLILTPGPHARPPELVGETAQNRSCDAHRRSLSFPRRTHLPYGAGERQAGNRGVAGEDRGADPENRGPAVDPARHDRQPQAQEIPCVL
jgi:hypothetical protein